MSSLVTTLTELLAVGGFEMTTVGDPLVDILGDDILAREGVTLLLLLTNDERGMAVD